MKPVGLTMMALVILVLSGCAATHSGARPSNKNIPLSSVPMLVAEVAQISINGFSATAAAASHVDGRVIYELHGSALGDECTVWISSEGSVVRIERPEETVDG